MAKDNSGDKMAAFNETTNKARSDKKKKKEKEKKKNPLKKEKLSLGALTLAGLLRGAWTNMINWMLLPILWVDFQFFVNEYGPKKLSIPLGSEWAARGKLAQDRKKLEKLSRPFKMPETLGCACINFGCLVLLIASLVLMSFLITESAMADANWLHINLVN